MNAESGFGSLKRQWQSSAPPLPEVSAMRARVIAETRAHRRALWLVGAVTLLMLGAALRRAMRSVDPSAWLTFGVATLLAALVWTVALWMSRGTWQARDDTLAAALEVSIRRCRSMMLAAPVGIALYVLGLVGVLAWKQRMQGIDWSAALASQEMMLAGWIGVPAYAAVMLWNARRQRARLKVLRALRRQLEEG